MRTLPTNAIEIVVHPRRFELHPKVTPAEFRPPWEPLLIAVDWGDNRGVWKEVVVCGFSCKPSGRDELRVPAGDERAHPVHFPRVRETTECSFEIHYIPTDGSEPLILDPGVIIKP